MPTPNQPSKEGTGLSHEKLVIAELESKIKAISGYDDILWKIRAGYVGILYGSLAIILGGQGIPDLRAIVSQTSRISTLFVLVFGFSISAYLVDSTYLSKKLKVIAVRDSLIRLVLNNTMEKTDNLSAFLLISGEMSESEMPTQARAEFKRIYAVNRLKELLPIYFAPPLLMLCIFLIVYFV
jgi:hypothetical protein